MNPSRHRLLIAFILAFWMSPSLGALGLGLHVILDHHHDETEHSHGASDLAQMALHGHHHDTEATPDHDHHLMVDGAVPLLRTHSSSPAMLPLLAPQGSFPVEASSCTCSTRPGATCPLFRTHCSLLI